MSPAASRDVREILEAASQTLDRHFELSDPSAITSLSDKDPVLHAVDAVGVYLVRARPRHDDAVLILSNSSHPDSVHQAVARARAVARRLPPALATTVLLPEYDGRHDGRSFAVYPRLWPLASNRLLRFAQKRLIRRRVLDWTFEIAAASCRMIDAPAELEQRFIVPLAHLADETGASDGLRRAAAAAAAQVTRPGFTIVTVIQHGDFWQDNILLNRGWPAARGYGFSVIDWGAAEIDGYPFIDFLRYGLSATRNTAWIAAGLCAHRERLALPAEAIPFHVYAGIGWLGMHRNNFPHARFLALAETLYTSTTRLAA